MGEMIERRLTPCAVLQQTQDHLHIALSVPHKVLSSAVLNGGSTMVSHIVNLRVPPSYSFTEAPAVSLEKYAVAQGWHGTCLGMMTAASMQSLRIAVETVQGVTIAVLVTAGLSNARRVGERAEYRQMSAQVEEVGTINIIVLSSAGLSDAAMVEALMMVTEAKAAALQDAGITSSISKQIATGTGTDSLAMICADAPATVHYCGKHVLFGEILGGMVMHTVAASIASAATAMQ
jgi:adenosylcobinamide amidohydrolase